VGSVIARIGGLAIGAAALAGFVVSGDGPPLPPRQVLCYSGAVGDSPLGGGCMMSTEQAERAFNPPVLRPQTDEASDATISELWVRPERWGEVSIVYDSGMVVTVEHLKRPTWQMARDFTADGSPGELIRVRGIDVFTVPPQRPCFGGNAAFNLAGAEVSVINDPAAPYDLVLQATESIIENAPAVIAADEAIDG
jgi:hypothetical protein